MQNDNSNKSFGKFNGDVLNKYLKEIIYVLFCCQLKLFKLPDFYIDFLMHIYWLLLTILLLNLDSTSVCVFVCVCGMCVYFSSLGWKRLKVIFFTQYYHISKIYKGIMFSSFMSCTCHCVGWLQSFF